MSTFWSVIFNHFTGQTVEDTPANTADQTPKPPPKCGWRLDTDSSATFTLPDGRKLGYAEYGSPTGHPVLYLHGTPASRLEGVYYHDLGVELGVRIISTDRPGIGLSSPQPDRKVLDFPKDLECLADHLGLEEYSVLGVSGGGPWALACAAAMPAEKLKCMTIVCGLATPDIGFWGMHFPNYLGWTYGWLWLPGLMRWYFLRLPIARVDLSDEKRLELYQKEIEKSKASMHPRDVPIYEDVDNLRMQLRSTKEALAQGFDGILLDSQLVCKDMGFNLEDIRRDLPVSLLYGRVDGNVPLNHGIQVASRLGSKAVLRIEEETHSSIFYNNIRWIVESVIPKS